MAGQAWQKWYWSDWRADPALRMCGYAARGLWADLLSLMHEAEPYGHLLINGKAPTPRQLAGLLGGSEREVKGLIGELRDAGVFSIDDHGVIFSRRMVRDKAKSDAGRAWGITGGNPELKNRVKGEKPDDAEKGLRAGDKGSHTRDPEARSQKPEYSEPIGSGAAAPPPKPEDAFWGMVAGVEDSKSFRGLAGRWLALHDGDAAAAMAGIEACVGKADPKTWLTASIATRKKAPKAGAQGELAVAAGPGLKALAQTLKGRSAFCTQRAQAMPVQDVERMLADGLISAEDVAFHRIALPLRVVEGAAA